MHVISFLAAFLASAAMASEVSSNDVARAATAFVSEDSIGSLVLKGCSVANVSQRGHLWIVALSPSGHIVMSGSDLADPIVAFSKNDFTEPEPESPAFAVLEGVDSSMAALEAQGDGTRHERWTKLLGGGAPKKGLLRADNPSNDAVVVAPFMHEHFDQCQPYNDYAPVHEPDENYFEDEYESDRGRCPCGCVATAAAQMVHYFRWPVRIDRIDSFNHSFTNANNVGTAFPLRLDGHVPIDWDTFYDDYIYYYWKGYTPCYDLRGKVAEMVRYPIARLILWCDVMANMCFNPNGSSANYDTITRNVSDWYTSGHWVKVGNNADYSQVVVDLRAGIPLQVSLDGHQVVAHGWADDGTSKYIYLNYGWGGGDYGNDGYYNMNNSSIDDQMQEIFVGHYPRAKPQIDPLPKVCETNVTVNWHFPDFYTNKLSGFTVAASKAATTTSTFFDDFSASEGSSSSSDIYVQTSGNASSLYSDYAGIGSYTYPKAFTLTSASELTFKVSSYAAISSTLEVQARFNGESWQTISTPDLDEGFGSASWNEQRVYLGGHGGEAAQFRIVRSWDGGYYVDSNKNRVDYGYVLIDDFRVTEVLAPLSPETQNVGKTARSYSFNGLDAGATYSFAVTPIMSGALVAAEASDPVTTSIAGEHRTPIPGTQTYSSQNLVFSTNDTSGVWSYSGTGRSNTSIRDLLANSITVNIAGMLTSTSTLSFSWMANCYYKNGAYDTFSAVFKCNDGTDYNLWSKQNTANKTSAQSVSVSLASYAGKSGKIVISYSHSGSQYTRDSYGGTLSNARVTNVQVPSVPAVGWKEETKTALGMPEIRSVSSVSEGFYGECGTNTSAFTVICSSSVESLEARPSHLSLVRDEDVTVTKTGSGTFNVSITPSGVNEGNLRSRMILTLVGTDANGTKCYKDLSLRFSEVAQVISDVVVSASASGGESYSVMVPYSWIEGYGLAPEGSSAAAHEAAVSATADADSDGLPNWAEFICGTDPSDPDDKLTVFIDMEDGKPVVTYSPDDGRIASGFKAVIKGTSDLALSTWEVVTETRTSTCRFFRVEIVPEN